MKKYLVFVPVLALSFFLLSACCKEGNGGEATLVVFLKHHTSIIKNHVSYPETVFIKFNAKDSPGDLSKYDTYFIGQVGEDHVHCPGLKCGDYYLFGTAMDSTGPYRVTGGMHLKIKHSERKKELDTDLAVTE